jgi:hypothetical protein
MKRTKSNRKICVNEKIKKKNNKEIVVKENLIKNAG